MNPRRTGSADAALRAGTPLILSLAIHASVAGGLLLRFRRVSPEPPRAARTELLGVSVVGDSANAKTTVHAHAPLAVTGEPSSFSNPTVNPTVAGLSPPASAGAAAQSELEAYALLVRERIGAILQYPLSLRRRGVSGRVDLKLRLDATGHLQSQEVSESSGSSELDALALEAAKAAQPYPAPSEGLKKLGSLLLSLPVEFKLR